MQTRYGIVAQIVPPSLPIWSQNGSTNFQNGAQNGQLAPKMGTKGSRWSQNGQDEARTSIFFENHQKGPEKVVLFLATKMVENRSKKLSKNRLFFDAGSGSIFPPFWSQKDAKREPRQHPNRYKNGFLTKKRELVLM